MSRRDLPNFFIVGAMKAGTTSLAKYLAQHDDVFMCDPKEPRYFMEAGAWDHGEEWYRSLFADAANNRARGEATTGYSKLPVHTGVAERISQVVRDARIVYLTREPIARIRSHYVHSVMHTGLRGPLTEALRTDSTYVDFSRYAFQIEPYRRIFGDDRVLILANEQMRDDRVATVDRVLEFIGVSPSAAELDLLAVSNEGSRKREQVRDEGLGSGPANLLRRTGLTKLVPKGLRHRAHHAVTTPVITDDDLALPPEVVARILSDLASDGEDLDRISPATRGWWDDPV